MRQGLKGLQFGNGLGGLLGFFTFVLEFMAGNESY